MNVTLLSGVVRNRKITSVTSSILTTDEINTTQTTEAQSIDSNVDNNNYNIIAYFTSYLQGLATCTSIFRNFKLRIHKFTFQWELVSHFSVAICSLIPFIFTGERLYAILSIIVWGFYNILFLIGIKRANALIPGFSRFKHAFQTSIEEFFSPKLLPIMSISFLLVVLSLAVTGRRLAGKIKQCFDFSCVNKFDFLH